MNFRRDSDLIFFLGEMGALSGLNNKMENWMPRLNLRTKNGYLQETTIFFLAKPSPKKKAADLCGPTAMSMHSTSKEHAATKCFKSALV